MGGESRKRVSGRDSNKMKTAATPHAFITGGLKCSFFSRIFARAALAVPRRGTLFHEQFQTGIPYPIKPMRGFSLRTVRTKPNPPMADLEGSFWSRLITAAFRERGREREREKKNSTRNPMNRRLLHRLPIDLEPKSGTPTSEPEIHITTQ